jgi:maltooligosyltrehalose trehalohydrolase
MTGVFVHDGGWSTFRESEWGRPIDPAKHRGHQFLAYLQNHDQVGNRAVGDRLSPALAPGLIAAGAALVLCGPFTPMLFMGEEWGASTPWRFFTDFDELQLAHAVRSGRREEFAEHGWEPGDVPDPQSTSTRSASVLDWSEATSDDHARLLDWYRSLISLRRTVPDFQDDDLREVRASYDEEAGWFVLVRGRYRVVMNLADVAHDVPVDGAEPDVVLSWETVAIGPGSVRVAPRSVAVVHVT